MDLRIQAIHFDIADRLSDFINKKVWHADSRPSQISRQHYAS